MVSTRAAQLFSDENGCKAAWAVYVNESRVPKLVIFYDLSGIAETGMSLKVTWQEVTCELRLVEYNIVGGILRRNKRIRHVLEMRTTRRQL